MVRKHLIFFLLFSGMLLFQSCFNPSVRLSNNNDTSALNKPPLTGKLIFHSYSCYTCNDSKIWSYDFQNNQLRCISNGWNISNPMNAHFSPDGNSIVFMGISPITNSWDVFKYNLNENTAPVNLTMLFGNKRDEDPKFSNDGTHIVFKQNGVLKEMDTLGNIIHCFDVVNGEASMPYYAKGDSVVIFSKAESNQTTGDIYKINLHTEIVTPLYTNIDWEEYYPVTIDDSSFYYTAWNNVNNQNDQIWIGKLNGSASNMVNFGDANNNYSDACYVNNCFLILSATKPGGFGGYDLYIADLQNHTTWNLKWYNPYINSVNNELGATYWNH